MEDTGASTHMQVTGVPGLESTAPDPHSYIQALGGGLRQKQGPPWDSERLSCKHAQNLVYY